MLVHPLDGLTRGLREPSGHRRVNKASAARANQFCSDLDCARTVSGPRHAERARMLDEKTMRPAPLVRAALLLRGHALVPSNIGDPDRISNLWPSD